MLILNNGLAESLGDSLVTGRPLQTPGNVWWVRSVGGVDGASPAGRDREKPLATLAQAQTNAANGDIVTLMDGHTETFTAALSITKSLTIAAGGSASGIPTVTFFINAAAQGVFTITADGVELRNIKFPASIQSNTGTAGGGCKLTITSNYVRLIGCYFESSGLDQATAVSLGATTSIGNHIVRRCTFISTATLVATRPVSGLSYTANSAETTLEQNVFSDGTVGWSSGFALTTGVNVITRIRGENNSFLLGAGAFFSATSLGYLEGTVSTGGATIAW